MSQDIVADPHTANRKPVDPLTEHSRDPEGVCRKWFNHFHRVEHRPDKFYGGACIRECANRDKCGDCFKFSLYRGIK